MLEAWDLRIRTDNPLLALQFVCPLVDQVYCCCCG